MEALERVADHCPVLLIELSHQKEFPLASQSLSASMCPGLRLLRRRLRAQVLLLGFVRCDSSSTLPSSQNPHLRRTAWRFGIRGEGTMALLFFWPSSVKQMSPPSNPVTTGG